MHSLRLPRYCCPAITTPLLDITPFLASTRGVYSALPALAATRYEID